MDGNLLLAQMFALADPAKVPGLSRFFKTGPGQYGEGDRFLGIPVPCTRLAVKECAGRTSWRDLEECIASEYHEIRLAALLMLVHVFRHARKDAALQKRCVDFYLEHLERVNNWDLVDLSCYELLGSWLLDKEDRSILYDLARNGRSIWEKRVGIVSTMAFVRGRELDDTIAIAAILLPHPHDLIHKAVGWLLREVGKRDEARLRAFLAANESRMSRTTYRYATELLK